MNRLGASTSMTSLAHGNVISMLSTVGSVLGSSVPGPVSHVACVFPRHVGCGIQGGMWHARGHVVSEGGMRPLRGHVVSEGRMWCLRGHVVSEGACGI
jgi:hypothetical protein